MSAVRRDLDRECFEPLATYNDLISQWIWSFFVQQLIGSMCLLSRADEPVHQIKAASFAVQFKHFDPN